MASMTLDFKADGYMYPVTLVPIGTEKLKVKFRFNRTLINEIKNMQTARWNPDEKCWTIANCPRNKFQIAYLAGMNPYKPYDVDINPDNFKFVRPLYNHQKMMAAHGLVCHHVIWACEMGTGKSLSAIEVIERAALEHNIDDGDIWYVGPVSGVRAVGRELVKWKCTVRPKMLTYAGLTKTVNNWVDGTPAPRIVIFDECSCIKNPTSQRSMAALYLANSMRQEHGFDGCYTILMSGTPAPKTPVDWWHQAEVACPGFLKEGDIHKFKRRMSLTEQRESLAGGTYPHLITWFDDENKCKKCGETKEQHLIKADCEFEPSINEVAYLYERLKGLVLVQFKKDCLDLPDKQYREIQIKPEVETLRFAKGIKNRGARAITVLTLLRELSDGFQYFDEESGTAECDVCKGNGRVRQSTTEVDTQAPNVEQDHKFEYDICPKCKGTGMAATYSRSMRQMGTPKDAVFKEMLKDHDDIGRFVVWGGFTGTIDRLVDMAHQEGWFTLRIDGRGYQGTDTHGNIVDADELLSAMDASDPNHQELRYKYPNVCVVAHPKAGGMGLTLTASPTSLFYSNVFDGEARMQAEDRIHRAGMDANRGATIIDLIHLPTDKLILDNLKRKKRLQNLTMSELDGAIK